MSEDDLLDMDCFLNEDVFGDDFGEEGFIFSKTMIICLLCPLYVGYFSFGKEPKANFPIK